LVKALHQLSVSAICLGYPFKIAQDKDNEFTVNVWSYCKLIIVIGLRVQEYGVKASEVVEFNTTKYCANHGAEVEGGPRRVVSCPLGRSLHSDPNGALNILKETTNSVISAIRKPPSFLVDHNGVAPVKKCNPRDLGNPRPSGRG